MPEQKPSPSPERAIYGFVLYLGSFLALVWAYVPDPWLESIGLTYLPQKYWAIAGPVFLCGMVAMVLCLYIGYSFLITAPLDSIHTIRDKHSRPVITSGLPDGAIKPIGDIDISEVNRQLYGDR
ncbi:phosphatidylinositol N-acetylglucosaminyltransferase subunit P-like isoform X2 [Lingula anatina]|uniref:Phosphatidylinositol N-acetylglucosaminyltransferase subunit P n=1 Tax=Lingula anatina TaxID=7574 RepID=A0A1S3IWI4_LINAN|nr:phosphatidylinositol N-acetylglucosaminyltransferase subunit P-like isoform X2 [Lingula anatina]|eukprot:XP_013402550.1 phosphatidylinositol N-acetylglucosaminyltransferase subunit P-like isoform X2 [Lingula anatina]